MTEFDSAYHQLHVTDDDGVRLLRFERNHQSSMHIDDPFETDILYVGYLHITMAVKPSATRTLSIGLGGGSLVKRMWRDYPFMHIDAVELDPAVVEIAHALFALPQDPRITVIVGDGREVLAASTEIYDIITIDAFADDRVPRPLTTEEFMRSCRDHMAPDGAIAYNVFGSVYGPHSRHFRSLHRTASNVWRNVWTFPVDIATDARDLTRNIVMLASDAELSTDELQDRIADRVGGLVTVPGFERFAEDLYLGKIRTGDVPLLLDEHPAPRKRGRT